MILNGDFFTIERRLPVQEGVAFGFEVSLNPEHYIFKSHFPGHPITPGVCLLQMVAELASIALECPLSLHSIKNAKYTGVVNPIANTHIEFVFTSCSEIEDGRFKVQAIVTDTSKPSIVFSKFSVTLVK